jgi:hypothetical protein
MLRCSSTSFSTSLPTLCSSNTSISNSSSIFHHKASSMKAISLLFSIVIFFYESFPSNFSFCSWKSLITLISPEVVTLVLDVYPKPNIVFGYPKLLIYSKLTMYVDCSKPGISTICSNQSIT